MSLGKVRKSVPVIVVLILTGLAGSAAAGPVPADPMLRIETGMHTAAIRRIAVDAAGRFLVTGSPDKSARVWDLASGALLRTLRLPIGPGAEGEVYAVALSPDGRLIAVAGSTGLHFDGTACIYLFDRDSGQMVRRIGGLPEAVLHLAFSGDGTRIAAALGTGGVRVFRMPGGDEVGQDASCGSGTSWADIDRGGRVVAVSDGLLCLYDAGDKGLVPRARWAPQEGRVLSSARFSPDGKKVAIGYEKSPQVDVLSAEDLRPLYRPDERGASKGLGVVTWSQDGALLYATGEWETGRGHLIRRWERGGEGSFTDVQAGRDRVEDLAALPRRRLVFGTSAPSWGIVAADGKRGLWQGSRVADFRGLGAGLRVDATGARVRFAYDRGQVPATFSVADHTLTIDPPGKAPPATTATVDATAEGGQWHVAAMERSLHALDRTGELRWEVALPASPRTVSISGDGRLVVAALTDGTLRWYRAEDGGELLSALFHADRKRWVLFTPAGFYESAKDADDLLGWHHNHGANEEAEFFRAALFRESLQKPSEIAQALRAGHHDSALGNAATALPAALLPPVVTIVTPTDWSRADKNELTVRAVVRSSTGDPASAVRVLINGEVVANRALVEPGTKGSIVIEQPEQRAIKLRPGEREYQIPVSIPPEDSTLAVVAETALARGDPALVHLRWSGQIPKIEHKLIMLAVGVSRYSKSELRLEYSAKDAADLVAELRKQQGKLYHQVETRVLVDREATRERILDGLKWLQEKTTPNDVAVLFLAGHGISLPGTDGYYYLPYDADPGALKQLISGDEIQAALKNTPGKRLLFLDTCHAGNVLGPGLFRGRAGLTPAVDEIFNTENGFVVFASSTGRQSSKESPVWRNGAFTRALVEGLRGRAAINETRRITVTMLDLYLSQNVSSLTAGLQTPTMAKSKLLPDFALAIGEEKPQGLPIYAVQRPLYKRWWLWSAVGTVVAAGVVTGIVLGTRSPCFGTMVKDCVRIIP